MRDGRHFTTIMPTPVNISRTDRMTVTKTDTYTRSMHYVSDGRTDGRTDTVQFAQCHLRATLFMR